MKERIKKLINSKVFHIVVIAIIIAVLSLTVLLIVLKYTVEGETNMPFTLSKITIISTSEGNDIVIPNSTTKWNFQVDQNNDIFLYIEKNELYGKTEAIDTIFLENFNMVSNSDSEKLKIYKPDSDEEKVIFKNKDIDSMESIEFKGGTNSNLKSLEISNQGDLIAFRCSNTNVVQISSDDEEINHSLLLRKAGITNDNLKIDLSFDITINLTSGKSFNATVKLQLPIGDVINQGTTSQEITDTSDIVFKRIKN